MIDKCELSKQPEVLTAAILCHPRTPLQEQP